MYVKLCRKHSHSTFSRVQSIRTRERHPLPGKKNTQVYIITFKATSLKKKATPYITHIFQTYVWYLNISTWYPRHLDWKLDGLAKCRLMQKLRSACEQLLSGLIRLFRNSCVALFFLCDTLPVSLKLFYTFFCIHFSSCRPQFVGKNCRQIYCKSKASVWVCMRYTYKEESCCLLVKMALNPWQGLFTE